MNFSSRFLITLGLVSALLLSSCASDPNVRAARSRGAVGGAGLGAIIGNNVAGIGQDEAMIAGAILGGILNGSANGKVRTVRTIEPGRTYR